MSSSGQKNLLNWAKKNSGGYPGVWVEDFSKSFRDGLAFCAIVHTYKHSLIPWDTLKTATEEDQLRNHRLAFEAAEKEWGVTQLLDPEDMLVGNEPDKLSVMTYLAEMYKHMKSDIAQGNPFEGNYLDQLAERQKKKLEEQRQQQSGSSELQRKPQVEVSKMSLNSGSSVDVSNIKGCGQCQKLNNYPMCPGFTPESFRKTRCQHCFHSTEEHLGFVSDEEKEEIERQKREKEEELVRLVDRARRRKEAKEVKKKQLKEQKLKVRQQERGTKLEYELKRRQEEYQNKQEERKQLLKQRQKQDEERQEKYMEARRTKRVRQREYDRKASTMEEGERKQLEEELQELTRIEEETKDPYVYDELEPIPEPPSDISEITLDDDEDIEIDSDEVVISDEELSDPMLDEIPIPETKPQQPVKQPIKKMPLKKMPPKKDPVKKDVLKKEVKKEAPKRDVQSESPSESRKTSNESISSNNNNTSSTSSPSEDSGDRSERRYKRYQRRLKILSDNQDLIDSIRLVRVGNY